MAKSELFSSLSRVTAISEIALKQATKRLVNIRLFDFVTF